MTTAAADLKRAQHDNLTADDERLMQTPGDELGALN